VQSRRVGITGRWSPLDCAHERRCEHGVVNAKRSREQDAVRHRVAEVNPRMSETVEIRCCAERDENDFPQLTLMRGVRHSTLSTDGL
jgi:hypothetical protein